MQRKYSVTLQSTNRNKDTKRLLNETYHIIIYIYSIVASAINISI